MLRCVFRSIPPRLFVLHRKGVDGLVELTQSANALRSSDSGRAWMRVNTEREESDGWFVRYVLATSGVDGTATATAARCSSVTRGHMVTAPHCTCMSDQAGAIVRAIGVVAQSHRIVASITPHALTTSDEQWERRS